MLSRARGVAVAAGLLLAACVQLEPGADARQEGLPEPDVFDVIRASNSKAAVDQLRDRHAREMEHARLLEARIGELIAAEEGLAAEHQERLVALQQIQDELRKLGDEQAKAGRALDEATRSQAELAAKLEAPRQANAELEKSIAAEEARRAELGKQAPSGSGGG